MRGWRLAAVFFLVVAIAVAGSAVAQTPTPTPTPPPPGTTVYVAFGDSVTAGVGDERQRGGYPPRLEARLISNGQNAAVRNAGLGAETTAEGVTRIDSVLRSGDDVLLLMEGTNDVGRGVSIETTVFNLNEIARKAEQRALKVVHATVIPRRPDANEDRRNWFTQRLNENIRDLAGTSGREEADPFEVFITTPNVFEDFYSDDPEDKVGHPNAAGYDLLSGIFYDMLTGRDSVPPVTGITRPATGRTGVRPDITIQMDVWDFSSGIELSATDLLVDGQVVDAAIDGNPKRIHIVYNPPGLLSGTVELGLRSRDRALPMNRVDRVVTTFQVTGSELDGDLDSSGRVDGVDLVMFAQSFGSTPAEIRYLPDADFNRDDVIDGEDLAVLASNFGQSSL